MLVENHLLFRQSLALLLDDEPNLRVIAQAGSLAEVRERATAMKNLIDVAIVDPALPDGDATVLIPELRRVSPGMKVLVLTASVDPETPTRVLDAGANAVLRKTVVMDEILAAVQSLLRNV